MPCRTSQPQDLHRTVCLGATRQRKIGTSNNIHDGHLGVSRCHHASKGHYNPQERRDNTMQHHLTFRTVLPYSPCDQRSEAIRSSVVRHLRYERGRLVCETDYVRGRMMKTDVTIFPDGRFTLTTTNRGEAASRWVAQLQGKKVLRRVPRADESESGD